MKLLPQKGIAFGGLAIALVTSPANAATLAIVPAPPTVDLLVSRGDEAPLGGGGSQATFGFRNADAAGTEGSRGRGQSFVINSTAGATYDISSLALSLAGGAGTAIRPDGDLTLTIFEYTGTGATAADQVNDTANWTTQTGGTSGTQIFSGSFPIAANMAFSGADVATFNTTQTPQPIPLASC